VIDQKLLDRHFRRPPESFSPEQAFDACGALGALARWWVPESLREVARRYQSDFPHLTAPGFPPLSGEPGACVAICRKADRYPSLELITLLPLRWVRGEQDRGLPSGWRNLADRIRSQFRGQGWSLSVVGAELADDLPVSPDSAWASLAAGLKLVKENLISDPMVWASAAWHERNGLAPVKHLEEKIAFGAKVGVTRFYVAPWQRDELTPPASIALEPLGLSDRPDDVVAPLVERFGAKPPPVDFARPDADEQIRRVLSYAQILTKGWKPYYYTHLLPIVVRRLRDQLNDRQDFRPSTLVAVVSGGGELISVLCLAMKIRRILIFFTRELEWKCVEVCANLPVDVQVERIPFTVATMRNDFDARLRQLATEVVPHEIVCDLTLGTKRMSMHLDEWFRSNSPSTWRCYVEHQTPDNRVQPGAEKLELWTTPRTPVTFGSPDAMTL